MAGGERVLGLLDTQPDVADPADGAEMGPIQGRVELRDVAFFYREDAPVLHDINLTIEPGQTVALVGPTGAGKTSIANLIARFYDVTGGAVLIDGVDVRRVTQHSLRRQMGLVPQDPFLFPGTIRDNIRFGHLQATQAVVEAAARAGQYPRIYRDAARWLRYTDPGRRCQSFGRPAPIDLHCARRLGRPAHLDPR